ncbi:MAG: hypothetical protein ACTHMC_01385 [Pseudobacter sp.]|uniref:hypothetical protein n=1 Tax=Pseudobacter sp. TaxID=2045420 RepID=UPI003F808B46
MAIVINNTPPEYASAQDDLIFTVYEATKANDPVTYPDYKYVCDIYVGANQVARLKSVPHPDNKRGVFNIGSIVRNYLSTTFNPASSTLRAQQIGLGEFFINVTVKFGEEYDFVLYTNLTVDSERRYYNHYNGRLTDLNTLLANYLDNITSARSSPVKVNRSENWFFLSFFPSSTAPITIRATSFNSSGTIDVKTQSYTPAAAFNLQIFNLAPVNLNNFWPGFINDAVEFVQVKFELPDAPFNPQRTIELTCEPRYQPYMLHFLNRFGGFDSIECSKVSRKEINIEKESYGRLPYIIDASGMVRYKNSNNVMYESEANYSSLYKEKMTLNTDILTDQDYQWLADLARSPLVYFEDLNHFVPVSVNLPTYDIRKRINDKLTSLPINIEFGNQLNAQYR